MRIVVTRNSDGRRFEAVLIGKNVQCQELPIKVIAAVEGLIRRKRVRGTVTVAGDSYRYRLYPPNPAAETIAD